ncbi:MAG: hypothetical protein RL336_1154 [Pseudomonadota bacterium]
MPTTPYRGRFAPSPSGPLHLGSLLAATASYLDAKANHGEWLVRIEDIDPPREQPGASDTILSTLLAHGLQWDGEVMYQSARSAAYDAVLDELWRREELFYCTCTRADLQGSRSYPGKCRQQLTPPTVPAAWRLRCDNSTQAWQDGFQGPQSWSMRDIGDTILKRKDGLYAYQLAVVVDDHAQGITHVVRGIDLIDSTPRQLYLFAQLHWSPPQYSHLPVILDEHGHKLSKQNHAPAVDDTQATANLLQCLGWLGQAQPTHLNHPADILAYAVEHWQPSRLQGVHDIALAE